MIRKSWLAKWFGRRRRTPPGRPRAALCLEQLETRLTPAVGFGKATLTGVTLTYPTSLQFGPDSRLYVAQQNGLIDVISVVRNGANSYAATATETIPLIKNIPNHNDNGTLNASVTSRQVTGILVTGTNANPVIFVTSSDPRIGGGSSGTNTGLDTNSGILSRVTWNGSTWTKLDLVRGLPRSEENHSSNGLALDPTTNTLYIAQGGNTNEGAPSNNFSKLPEYALSAAILSVNLNAIGNTTYDLPDLVDDNAAVNANSPFGGDFGKHQAKIVPGGPVQVYASGFRNPYDIVLAQSGQLYSVDNGSNAGWGDVPLTSGGQPTTAATAGTATNAIHEPGVQNNDALFQVTPGLYAGHPNPTRANRLNTFNTTSPQSPVPTADPQEGYFVPLSMDGNITNFGPSTNGITQYTAGNFSGAMQGDLLVAGFDNTIRDIKLNSTGTISVSNTVLFSNVDSQPLDVTPGTAALAGTIWVADYTGAIIVYEPNDFSGGSGVAGTGADDPTIDEAGNHYSNHDKIANGINPLQTANTPPDLSQSFVSNKLNPNDDNDGLADTKDPFAIDAANGKSTQLPVNYTWVNGAPSSGGLLNLGFTGLMTNGVTNYASLYDASTLTAGGAAGVLTIGAVTAGTAKGAANNQNNGFQFGVNAISTTPPFVVHTQVKGPFVGITPKAGQQIGLQFGTGDQDNYVELAIDGGGSVQLMKEVGGAWSSIASTSLTLGGQMDVDLYITVNPAAGTVTGGFTTTVSGVTSALKAVGGATSIPSNWFSWTVAGVPTAPAVGIMTTTGGNASFTATYKGMSVQYTWASGANLPTALREPGAAIVNGILYVFGDGVTTADNQKTLANNLATNTWTSNLAQRPFYGDHQAVEVINGKLYLFGGLDGNSDGKVQSYDPVANTWTQLASMPFPGGSVSTAVIGGLVYAAGGIIGGTTNQVGTNQAEVYNPATNKWSAIASMPQGLNHSASGTDGSKLYIFGGRTGSDTAANGFNTVEIYDPKTNTWLTSNDPGSTIPPLPQARGGMGKAVYYGGEFYVMGGETLNGLGANSNNVYDRVDIYNPTTQTWRLGTPMATALHGIYPVLGTTAQGGTKIYVAAGGIVMNYSNTTILVTYLLAPPAPPAPTVPAAPTLLTAQGALPTRVILNWQSNSQDNETGFQIERKTGTGAYAVLATLSTGVITYTDVNVVAGTQYTYRVLAKNSAGNSGYTNEVPATAPVPTDTTFGNSADVYPYVGTPWPVPGLIQAENFDYGGEGVAYHNLAPSQGGVYRSGTMGLEATTDTGGGFDVTSTLAGEWMNYTVNVASAGAYTLNARVASAGVGGTLHVEFGGVDQTGALTVPDTGGLQNWQTLSVPVQLSAGQQVMRLVFDTVGAGGSTGSFNWLNLAANVQNQPPVVSAGSNQTITLPASAALNGTATDSTLPNGPLVTTWSTVSGPGTVSFGNANALATTASFSTSGTYVLRLTASDGQFAPTSNVTITVNPAAAGPTVTGLTLIDTSTNQPVPGVTLVLGATNTLNLATLPQGLSIRADVGTGVASVRFGYDTNSNKQTESVAPYSFNGDNHGVYNPFTFTVGTHTVTARAFSGSGATGAAGIQVTMTLSVTNVAAMTARATNAVQNQPPVVSAGSNQTITLPALAVLTGTATASTLPNGPLVTTWTTVSGPGTVTFGNANALATTASFSASGTYVLELAASDGQFTVTSDVTITVNLGVLPSRQQPR